MKQVCSQWQQLLVAGEKIIKLRAHITGLKNKTSIFFLFALRFDF